MTNKKSFTRYFPAIARILLGLPLFASGLFGLLNLTPQPTTPLAEGAMAFADALVKSGYMIQLIFITQFIVGLLLLINRFVPLAIVLLAPFIVNSMGFHIFLEHTGLPIAAVFLLLELYLAWQYRKFFASVLTLKAAAGNN
jgi:uncharacterized membrane protein YphA (DoxX/SURF4 family)